MVWESYGLCLLLFVKMKVGLWESIGAMTVNLMLQSFVRREGPQLELDWRDVKVSDHPTIYFLFTWEVI